MNVLLINTVNFGSTGNIMTGIADMAREKGYSVWCAYPKYKINLQGMRDNSILIGNKVSFWIHSRLFRALGYNGCGSIISTIKLLRKINKLQIDLIHLHNLHDCYINFPLLFYYIKRKKIPVVWTLHDCWPFTGKCVHYEMNGCQKWKSGCGRCPQLDVYPATGNDKTLTMWKIKKNAFNGVPKMVLVTPSLWMANQVKKSFLSNYPVKTIWNGIDLSVFYRRHATYDFNTALQNKHVVLGVSFGWNKKKGLDVLVELAKRLDGNKYQVVIVGTNDDIDSILPSNVISIHRTQNQSELAEIYSSANVFVNPTREDTFPTVNIEALACGTPVVTFNTGGSPEVLDDTCGYVVNRNDIDSLEKAIIRICEEKPFSSEACIHRAQECDKRIMLQKYMEIYAEIL